MSATRRRLLMNALKFFDLALMTSVFLSVALFLLHQTRSITAIDFLSIRVKIQNFAIFSIFVLIWHVLFCLSGLYTSRRLSRRRSEIIDIVKATSLGTLVILIGASILHIDMTRPLPYFLVLFWLGSTISTVSSRLALRVLLSFVRKRGRNLQDVVIVGTNARALQLAHMLESRPDLGYRISGFIDQEWFGLEAFRASGYNLVTDLDDFPRFLRNSVVDEVIVALPLRSMHEQASRVAASCEKQGITVRVLPAIFDLKIARSSAEELEGNPFITHSTGWADGWPVMAKRVVDLIVSAIAIATLSPLLLLVAILIKASSSGKVLFIQKRVGLHKRRFPLYKFRTMVADAEQRIAQIERLNEVPGPVFKIKEDPRITHLGKLLRKTSIDELPQLFNVLIGDMSLVGPRPLPVRDYEGFNDDWQRRRFSVKPGITCLWQVRGRSSIPFDEWMELDLQYIEKWSLWLDFQILLRTIPAVLRGSGAA